MVRLSLVALAVGVLLVGFSLTWPYVAQGGGSWTNDDARQYREVAMNLHNETYAHSGEDEEGHSRQDDSTLVAARHRFAEAQQQLDQVRARGQRTIALCRWLGVLSTLGGGFAFFVARNQS